MIGADDPRKLTEQWIDAWVHVRSLEVSQLDGWPLVHTRSVTRESELICSDPGPEAFTTLMPHIAGDARAMLTVIAADVTPYRALDLPPSVRIDRDDETLMTITLAALGTGPIPDDLTPCWVTEGNAAKFTLETADAIAAEGTVGVLGTDAVFDAVETSPGFQRRGLGRHTMAALMAYAMVHGASRGLLAASAPGRKLYEALGWEPTLEMWSLMGVAPTN